MTPHEGAGRVPDPVWLPDSSGFYARRTRSATPFAISRYTLARRRGRRSLESEWDLDCPATKTGGRSSSSRTRTASRGSTVCRCRRDGVAERLRLLARRLRARVRILDDRRQPFQAWVHDFDSGEALKLTDLGSVADGVEPELHRVASFDGEAIPVFLFMPEGDGPFPVVVTVHGGPESQWQPWYSSGFGALTQYLVGRGYAVAAPNVRGSSGYGKRFEHLDDVEKRLDSVEDLASLHAWLSARPEIDGSRAVVYGGSYGGYMVLASLAFQPELWAAGI